MDRRVDEKSEERERALGKRGGGDGRRTKAEKWNKGREKRVEREQC